jgi:primary-amine oxidase
MLFLFLRVCGHRSPILTHLWYRKVFIVLHSPSKEKTYEMIISLFVDEVTSLKHLPGVQPRLMPHEYILMEQLVRRHPDVIEALKKRGITDLEKVKADLWGCGWFTDDDDPKRRLGFPLLYYKRDDDAEEYNTPIEGIVPLVDLNKMEVLKVDDLRVLPLPPATSNYRTKYKESKLPQPKPLIVSQPEGVSFSLDGWHLTWQNWDMRIGFNPREGVVLQQVGILDPDTLQRRSILHRASLAEMIVPYSHPQAPHYRKNAFDVGEDGMGVNLNSLRGGCDCIGEPRFLDVHLTDGDGNLYTIPDAICVHEEDAGILFKHTDYRTGQAYMRRGRRLVVSCFATIANYDYGLSWLFYLDGTIQYEATLTGILSTKVVGGGESRFGPTVGPYVAATNHQHFFCMKLDMAVDGPKNSVSEINTETVRIVDAFSRCFF